MCTNAPQNNALVSLRNPPEGLRCPADALFFAFFASSVWTDPTRDSKKARRGRKSRQEDLQEGARNTALSVLSCKSLHQYNKIQVSILRMTTSPTYRTPFQIQLQSIIQTSFPFNFGENMTTCTNPGNKQAVVALRRPPDCLRWPSDALFFGVCGLGRSR